MHRGLRLIAAAAALIVVLDLAVVVARSGDDDDAEGRTAVLGARVERSTTTAAIATSTTLGAALPALESTSTSAVPILGGTETTATTARSVAPTTTLPGAPAPRRVTEASDNTASFVSGPGNGTPINVVENDPADPFRFIIQAQDANQDGTAEIRTDLANQTQRDIAFPGGLRLRFTVHHNGAFWRTVELSFPDVQTLPARGSLEIESAIPLTGPGRYDVAGQTAVEYR